jgi:hypothetical protein
MKSNFELAARAQGWRCGGDHDDVIYNMHDYGSWKEAVSWAPEYGSIYETWEECCDMESIQV